ncbi:translation initiation factor IF-2-like [Cervus canadensis]|uniref:translation initiation factor IF-2-like n=1 Tax=Cervus canadensis TaxID=1574408 RepID=UPI001CA35DF5|nr:translation initiation factor IF-2-like [Cervus canadensis]
MAEFGPPTAGPGPTGAAPPARGRRRSGKTRSCGAGGAEPSGGGAKGAGRAGPDGGPGGGAKGAGRGKRCPPARAPETARSARSRPEKGPLRAESFSTTPTSGLWAFSLRVEHPPPSRPRPQRWAPPYRSEAGASGPQGCLTNPVFSEERFPVFPLPRILVWPVPVSGTLRRLPEPRQTPGGRYGPGHGWPSSQKAFTPHLFARCRTVASRMFRGPCGSQPADRRDFRRQSPQVGELLLLRGSNPNPLYHQSSSLDARDPGTTEPWTLWK